MGIDPGDEIGFETLLLADTVKNNRRNTRCRMELDTGEKTTRMGYSNQLEIDTSYIKQIPRIRVYMFVLPKFPHFDVFCWQLTLFIKN
jgi:hypothetical protein